MFLKILITIRVLACVCFLISSDRANNAYRRHEISETIYHCTWMIVLMIVMIS